MSSGPSNPNPPSPENSPLPGSEARESVESGSSISGENPGSEQNPTSPKLALSQPAPTGQAPPGPSSPAGDQKRQSWKPRIGLTLAGLWLLFTYVPLTRAHNHGPIYSRLPNGEWSIRNFDLRHWRGLRVQLASGEISTTLQGDREIHDPLGPVPARRIWIVCRTAGKALHEIGSSIAVNLLDRDEIIEVAFFPFRQLPVQEYRPPDIWITLDQIESSSVTAPGYFTAEGLVEVRVQPYILTAPESEGVRASRVVQVGYETRRIGFVSAAGRSKSIGDAVSASLEIDSYLDRLQGMEGPALPALTLPWLHGAVQSEPVQPLLNRIQDLRRINSGPAWLVHDASAWTLDTNGQTAQVGRAILDELQALDWQVLREDGGSATLRLGARLLEMRPLHGVPGEVTFAPKWQESDSRQLTFFHFHPFSAQESEHFLENAMRQALTGEELKSMLMHIGSARRQDLVEHLERLLNPESTDPKGSPGNSTLDSDIQMRRQNILAILRD